MTSSINDLTELLGNSMTLAAPAREYCCASFDCAISKECRRCTAKYFNILYQSTESVNDNMMRIISEDKTLLFEVVCDGFFGDLLPDPDYISYEKIYKMLHEADNKVFNYINMVTNLIIDAQNTEFMKILQSYLASWLDGFGGGKRDDYYEKCIDVFYEFFDAYINKICSQLVDECNTRMLAAVLRSYNDDIYEIDIPELIITSIRENKYDSFRFLYEYYTTEICEGSINIHIMTLSYRAIFIHDRIDMFRLLYKLTGECINNKRLITKLLDRYNDDQECSKLFKSKGLKAQTIPAKKQIKKRVIDMDRTI